MFDRALGVIKGERRRFEQERADWDVERIRLKAKISAYEKRIELLGTQYMAAQRQISILESLLGARSSSSAEHLDNTATATTTTDAAAAFSSSSSSSVDGVQGLVKETARRRERSRMLLERCLEEIDVLLAPPSSSSLESPSAASIARRRGSVDALGPNGVIESETAANASGSWQLRLSTSVSAPIIGGPIGADHRGEDGRSAAAGMLLGAKKSNGRTTGALTAESHEVPAATGLRRPHQPGPSMHDRASYVPADTQSKPKAVAKLDIDDDDEEHEGDDDDDDDENENENDDDDDDDDEQDASESTSADMALFDSSMQTVSDSSSLQSMRVVGEIGRGLEALKVDEVDIAPAKTAASQWQIQKSFTGHLDTVRSICVRDALSEDAAQMLSGSDDGMVILWDVERGSRRKSRKRPTGDIAPQHVFRGHLASVTSVVWDSSAHGFAYSGSLDSSIKVWAVPKEDDPEACFAARELVGHTDAVWDLSLSARAGLLASVGADGSCRLWSVDPRHAAEPARRVVMGGSSKGVPASTAFVDAAGARVAVGYVSGDVVVFDAETGGAAVSVGGLPRVTRIAWNGENLAAVACVDGSVRICDLRGGDSVITLARPLMGFNEALTAVDAVVGQPCAVAGASDGVVTWWDWRNPAQQSAVQVVRHRTKGDEGVCAVQAFGSASGARYVASAGSDAQVFFSKMKA
ncbi:1,2-dihydroxy-3-keto-5-methylthiopentene dioxygenase [Coemansia sp. RSA 2599]|nr:1,2-dihydroxy-3-keto-5-methylthiopentene dioxygenase [Coemansia sp. RSA 2598]KAJ1828811.1 1,2-dihydroxy-3-keto-5-methylthiopentene dioxygenase [Coemansia sp. RSA 2599]